MKVTELVAELARPIVEEQGCELWDVEYVREGSEYFLRLYLDKEGGVDINDCEAVSRAMDPILDEKDPIPTSYHFRQTLPAPERPEGNSLRSEGIQRGKAHRGSGQRNHYI